MHLLRDRRFALLVAGQGVNAIGSWAALIALWTFAAYHFHSGPGEIAVLTLCWSAPAAVLGPLGGVPVDRFGPRRVLIVAYALAATCALVMALAGSLVTLGIAAALVGVCQAGAQPALNALPPRIVADPDLLAANAVLGAAEQSAMVFGPLVGAGAIATVGMRGAFLVDAVTYLVGLAAVAQLHVAAAPARDRQPVRVELRDGLRIARALPSVRVLLAVSAAAFVSWHAFVVFEPLYVRDVLHRPPSQLALFQVAFGVGLVTTTLLLPRLGDRVASTRTVAGSVALSGVGAVLYIGTSSVTLAYTGVALWGVAIAFFDAPSRTVLQRAIPHEAHGRVLALYWSLHNASQVVALPIAGTIAAVAGVQTTAVGVATLMGVAGVAALGSSALRRAGEPADLAAAA